jgi:hypothetical protein
MSQKFIDIFKVSCVKLAHTVVINHPYAGIVINKRLEQEGFGRYTNTQDRNTWKYYLNMAGIYHLYDSAKIHKINRERKKGMDLEETIKFSIENSPAMDFVGKTYMDRYKEIKGIK